MGFSSSSSLSLYVLAVKKSLHEECVGLKEECDSSQNLSCQDINGNLPRYGKKKIKFTFSFRSVINFFIKFKLSRHL